MPNFRELRDRAPTSRTPTSATWRSETVIAHNVIVSGSAQAHGLDRRGLPRHRQRVRQGADAMHITGDLSLADFARSVEQRRVPEARGLPAHRRARHEVHHRGGEVLRRGVARPGRAATSRCACPSRRTSPGLPDRLPEPVDPGVPGNGRRPAARTCRLTCSLPTCAAATTVRPVLHQPANKGNDYGTQAAFPSWLYPGGQPVRSRQRPAHLGGDTWVADAAIAMMQNENWSGMFVTLGGIDKAGHMWGAAGHRSATDCAVARQDHVRLRGRERRRAARQTARQAPGARSAGRDAGRADRRPRRDLRRELLRQDELPGAATATGTTPRREPVCDGGGRSPRSVRSERTSTTRPVAGHRRVNADGNLQFSYQSTADRGLAARPSKAKQEAAAAAMLDARGDRVVLAGRRPLPAHGTNEMTKSEQKWWKKTRPGHRRHHGGRQRPRRHRPAARQDELRRLRRPRRRAGEVQRVPMVFWSPATRARGTAARRTSTPST